MLEPFGQIYEAIPIQQCFWKGHYQKAKQNAEFYTEHKCQLLPLQFLLYLSRLVQHTKNAGTAPDLWMDILQTLIWKPKIWQGFKMAKCSKC